MMKRQSLAPAVLVIVLVTGVLPAAQSADTDKAASLLYDLPRIGAAADLVGSLA